MQLHNTKLKSIFIENKIKNKKKQQKKEKR